MDEKCFTCHSMFKKRPKGYQRKLISTFVKDCKKDLKDIVEENYGISVPKFQYLCDECSNLCIKTERLKAKLHNLQCLSSKRFNVKISKKDQVPKAAVKLSSGKSSVKAKRPSISTTATKYILKSKYRSCFRLLTRKSRAAKRGLISTLKTLVREELRDMRHDKFFGQSVNKKNIEKFAWQKTLKNAESKMPILTTVVKAAMTNRTSEMRLQM